MFSSALNAYLAAPVMTGRIFWVSPADTYVYAGQTYSASDNNDGLHPKRALRTVAQALTLVTAGAYDIILLFPGTHSATAALAFSKSTVTVIGLPHLGIRGFNSRGGGAHRPPAIITQATAATNLAAVTAADVSFINVTLRPITQGSTMTFTTAADRLLLRDCLIEMRGVQGHANTKGVIASGATQAPDGIQFRNCHFLAGTLTTSAGIALEIGAATNFLVEGCAITQDGSVPTPVTWTTAVQCQDNCAGVFRDNDINANGATITNGIRGVTHTGAGIVQFIGNRFSVSVTNPITAWAAADVGLALNYKAEVSGGTGGATMISVST